MGRTDDEVRLLRRACERAGLKSDSRGVLLPGARGEHFLDWGNPALPAYVASLLVAMVRKPGTYCVALERIVAESGAAFPVPAFATDEQRIRAAMEVLGDGS